MTETVPNLFDLFFILGFWVALIAFGLVTISAILKWLRH